MVLRFTFSLRDLFLRARDVTFCRVNFAIFTTTIILRYPLSCSWNEAFAAKPSSRYSRFY